MLKFENRASFTQYENFQMVCLGRTKRSFSTKLKNSIGNSSTGFTLIEILVVIAIIGALAVVVVMTLNPAEIQKRSRDTTRLVDLVNINKALAWFQSTNYDELMGETNKVYVSIPYITTSTNCANLGLPDLPNGWTYGCAPTSTYRNPDGFGWIPIAFSNFPGGSSLAKLPIDPVNTTSSSNYYTYVTGGSWELNAILESNKYRLGGSNDVVSKDGGDSWAIYEFGNNLTLSPINDSGLVGYWMLDEGTGTSTIDWSGQGNNGTLLPVGSEPTWQSGGSCKTGKCLSFDGTDDYIQTPLDIGGLDAKTFTGWFKIDIKSVWRLMVMDGNVFDSNKYSGLVNHGDYGIVLYQSYNNGSSTFTTYIPTASYQTDVWYHVTGVINKPDNSLKIYLNGVLKNTYQNAAVGASTFFNPTGTVGVGGGSGGYKFDGLIDEVRIYNRALLEAEIAAIYNATR